MKHVTECEYTSGQMTRDLILLGGSIFVSGAGFGGAVLSSIAATCSWTIGTPSMIVAIVGGLGAWASALHIYDGGQRREGVLMADTNILAALDAELDGSNMLVLLPRPTKNGRRLDWGDIEYRPEPVTLRTSALFDDARVLKITATYKVPDNGKLVERKAQWWVSASSIGIEVLAAGGRYARISVKEIRECGTYRSMSDGQEWRNVAALARLVVFHCRSLWDFR